MFNLIKKDFIVCVKSDRFNLVKYILIFILMYLFCNDISYYATPVIITYLIIIGVFSSDYENGVEKFIRSLPIDLDDIVYSRYIIAIGTSISVTIVTLLMYDILSLYMFRSTVFNDFLFSLYINLMILSVTMPLFFKYGYEKMKIVASIIAIAVFTIFSSFLNALSEKIFYAKHLELSINLNVSKYETIHLFNQIFRSFISKININNINMTSIGVICITIFIFSMYISLKAMKKNKYLK